MSAGGSYGEGPIISDRVDLHGLLPELNGVELAMSLSPKHHHHHHQGGQVLNHLQQLHHSTPFSVTDILSPIEESYRKLELAANPPSPYRYMSGTRWEPTAPKGAFRVVGISRNDNQNTRSLNATPTYLKTTNFYVIMIVLQSLILKRTTRTTRYFNNIFA